MTDSTAEKTELDSDVDAALDAMTDSTVIDLRTDVERHTLIVEGEVDITTAPKLHERLSAAFESEVDEIVVDLRDVSFIDSTGLGVLVNARQRARQSGARLRLILPEGQARFPFEVTGLASMFEMGHSETS